MPVIPFVMRIIILILIIVQLQHHVQPLGEWPAPGSGHLPVQLSAYTYMGNKHTIVSPSSFLLKINLLFVCVDSILKTFKFFLAPND